MLKPTAALLPLLLPLCQVWLHRQLSGASTSSRRMRRLQACNHLAFVSAVLSWLLFARTFGARGGFGAMWLLLIPACAFALLLWCMFSLRCRRMLD
jgi:hypothetical protein